VIQLRAADIYVRNSLVDIYREGQLNNLPPDQTKNWILNASLDCLGSLPSNAALNYRLLDKTNSTILSGPLANITSNNTTITGSVIIPDGAVDLWWPNGMGSQTLYHLTIEVVDSSASTIASVNKRVGFRTIVLNEGVITQEQLDQGIAPGNNWHFEINGHEFYAKGSSIYPGYSEGCLKLTWPRFYPSRRVLAHGHGVTYSTAL